MLGCDLSKLLSHCKVQVTQLTKRNVLLRAGRREVWKELVIHTLCKCKEVCTNVCMYRPYLCTEK